MRRDITMGLRETSILLPYRAERFFDAQPNFVLKMFINDLVSQGGARVLSLDEKAAVVSWFDTAVSFSPLQLREANKLNTYGIVNKSLTTNWNGYVYGCARIVTSEEGAWLAIRAIGRDATSGERVFSDGTYERKLLGSLTRTINAIAIGQRMEPEFKKPEIKYPIGIRISYEKSFKSGFKKFPKIANHNIIKNNQGERYNVSADRLWRAYLEVITQYAVVPYLQSDEKVVVFSRRIPVPTNINKKKVKPIDVIMALTIQSADKEHSIMYISLLGKKDLLPSSIDKKFFNNQEKTEIDLSKSPIDTAAAILIGELMSHVNHQLYYNENLGNKLLRRVKQ